MNAKEAKQISDDFHAYTDEDAFNDLMEMIRGRAKNGHYMVIIKDLSLPNKTKLEALGYKVKHEETLSITSSNIIFSRYAISWRD